MEKTFKVYGFCSCTICRGISAKGTNCFSSIILKPNYSILAPKTYPLGTRIILDGYGTFHVVDVGGSLKQNRIDRYFSTHQEVLSWGFKYCKGKVVY